MRSKSRFPTVIRNARLAGLHDFAVDARLRFGKRPRGAVDPDRIAERIGEQPLLLLGLLVLAALASLGALLLTLRFSRRHARALWGRALSAWATWGGTPRMQRLERRVPTLFRLMRTLTKTEYLVIHVAIGLFVTFATLAFAAIAEGVFRSTWLPHADVTLSNALHASADPRTIAFFRLFTYLGSEGVVVAGGVVTVVLLLKRERLLAIGWALSLIGGALLNAALKSVFTRPRPAFADPVTVAKGFSFPSGHAMSTWIATGMLVYVASRFLSTDRQRLGALAIALVFCVTMGFSRMVLGVHFLTDVLGGFAAGTVWLGACISGLEIARRRPRSAPLV